MIKLIKGELKKIFLKPAIFVITALLVIALTVSVFIYKPAVRNDAPVSVPGNTVNDVYSASFGASSDTSSYYTLSKISLNETYIKSSNDIIEFYLNQLNDENLGKKQELLDKLHSIKVGSYLSYKNFVDASKPDNEDTIDNLAKKDEKRNKVKEELIELNNLYTTYINGNNGFYYVLMSSNEKTNLDVFLSSCLSRPFSESLTHLATINEIETGLNMFNNLEDYINKMENFSPKKTELEKAKSNLDKSVENLNEIENQIVSYKNNNAQDKSLESKKEINRLISRYAFASENAFNLTVYTINGSALNNLDDNEIQNLYQFEDAEYKTKYLINEQKEICEYYLKTNKYANEYANALSLSQTSNFEANAYDFMYFALEICSFIIIVYIVYLGATMITGEYAGGTMKLLAIRPYSRRKILLSKLLATIIVGAISLLITFIVTFIIGAILFGLSSMPVLLTFNASSAVATSPVVIMLILFICKMLEVMFYAIFSLALSTLFKSNAGSIIVSILVYFASFVLSVFSANIGILKILPFVNTNLFIYFGSHLTGQSNSLLANMFSRVIGADMNFYISFAIITIFSVIIYVLTSALFRKRDIK